MDHSLLTYAATATYRKRIYSASDWPEFRDAVEAQNSFATRPVMLINQKSNLYSQP